MPDTHTARTNGQALAGKVLTIVVVGLCILFVAAIAGDYLVLRIRMAKSGPDSVTSNVTFFYAAPLKGSKEGIYSENPQAETCVHSIFPWLGYDPCWYARSHTIQLQN